MSRPRKNNSCWFVLCLVAVTGGCEATGSGEDPFAWLKPKPREPGRSAAQAPDGMGGTSLQPTDTSLSRLTSTDNGLAVRKWVVADDEQRIRSVLMRHAVGGVVHDEADQRLQRNGFRLIQVHAEDLNALLAELGGSSLDVTAWHGQVYDWRTIASHGIGRSGQPLAIDGHVRQFPAGEMRMVMRSWIVAMESGPYVQFELVPQFHKPQQTDVNLLLGRHAPPPIESYPSMAVDHLLESGSAYLLTCAPPQSEWSTESAEAQPDDLPDDPELRRSDGDRIGPADMLGPAVTAPQTIGQWMLSNDVGRPNRIVLVLLPRISQRLFPPTVAQGTPSDGR
jgi:hypothetical protein